MATRRSNNGTPNPPAAPRRTRRGWVAIYNRRLRRRIQRLGNAHVERVGARWRTMVDFYGERNATLDEARDWLAEYTPPGHTYATVIPEYQTPFSTHAGPWLHTYNQLQAWALDYLEHKRNTTAYDLITVQIYIFTKRAY